jgi:hypothetical protein
MLVLLLTQDSSIAVAGSTFRGVMQSGYKAHPQQCQPMSTPSNRRLDAIHQVMKEGLLRDEATVVADSLSKLDYLFLEDANGSLVNTACELNALAVVVRCMKLWLHKEEILEVALWCLHQLASAQEESRAVIVDQGGVEVIVGAMKLYPNAVDIESGGCLALAGVLTPPFSSAVKSVSSHFVTEWNGISLVFRAMDK